MFPEKTFQLLCPDAVMLRDSRTLLVFNRTRHGRNLLNVAVSPDARNWHAAMAPEQRPGEYSYPAVIQSADDLVHVAYTWRRERIKHVVLDPAQFKLHKIENGKWPEQKFKKRSSYAQNPNHFVVRFHHRYRKFC